MDRSERIRSLRYQGLSEEEAIRQSHRAVESARKGRGRLFAVVTKDMSGLGFAKKLAEEGESVVLVTENEEEKGDGRAEYERVGKGWLDRMPLSQARTELKGESTYWLFTENNFPKVADKLRSQGQKVFGTSAFSDRMEHDRDYAIEEAKSCGLKSPETIECHSREEGLTHLQAHEDTAYVLKPDKGQNADTFVPELEDDVAANEETTIYLEHLKKEPTAYILQERVSGIEVNLEAWMYEGRPFFAFATLEAKRKQEGDTGEMAGCAGDVAWVVDLESPLVKQTIAKMFPLYQQERYTGFADVNVILTDKGPYFLEACCRFGYNAHPTLFLGLAKDGVGNILADWMDGKIEGIAERFGPEFATSICVFLDHPQEGLPVHVAYEEQFFPFDGYKEEGHFLLAGYSPEVGIFVDRGETVEAAFQAAYDKLVEEEAMSYPNRYFRMDLADTGYPNAIVDRYRQLEEKGLTGRDHSRRNGALRQAAVSDGGGLYRGGGRALREDFGPGQSGSRVSGADPRTRGMVSLSEAGDSD